MTLSDDRLFEIVREHTDTSRMVTCDTCLRDAARAIANEAFRAGLEEASAAWEQALYLCTSIDRRLAASIMTTVFRKLGLDDG